jgi:hypothetical protein
MEREGPFQPPAVHRSSHRGFDRVSAALVVGLVLCSACLLVRTGLTLIELTRFSQLVVRDPESTAERLFFLAWFLSQVATLFSHLACGPLFCVFMNRTHVHLAAAGADMQFGKHAWAWFFCPVFGLWKPYQAVAELWIHGRPRADRVPPWFRIWWGAWVVGCIASAVTNRLRDAEGFGAAMAAEWGSVVASLVLTIAAVAAAWVVHDTHARALARHGGKHPGD